MSVPVSTTIEVFGKPAEYKSGEMNAMIGDGQRKVAFITGTTGQDGSYLVELLLRKGESFPSPRASCEFSYGADFVFVSLFFGKMCLSAAWLRRVWHADVHSTDRPFTALNIPGYIVHGIKRRSSSYNHPRLEHILEEGACAVSHFQSSLPRPQLAPSCIYRPAPHAPVRETTGCCRIFGICFDQPANPT